MNSTQRSTAWYEEWFDRSEYELVYKRRDEVDARRLLHLITEVTGVQPGGRVLDMACGRGRHSRLLATDGFRVTGIDLSTTAIDKAKETASADGLEIDFRVGDMRQAPCSGCFDLVVNLFTSFGYFDDDTQNEKAIVAMATSLADGGWFAQDFLNGGYLSTNLVPFDEHEEDGITVQQRRWIEGGRLNKEIRLIGLDGDERVFRESVRLFDLADFERMYDRAELEIEHLFGDTDGGEYNEDSKRLILFSRRRST